MPPLPAARVGDNHNCPAATPGTPPVPHVGGPILPPGCPTVQIESQPAACVGDLATCAGGPPATITRGAFPVVIGGRPATRLGDPTSHGGLITTGASTVFIGSAGISGNPWAGFEACQAAAQGRASGSTQQSYQNCGVESARQIINQATWSNIGEDDLLTQAMDNGWAERASALEDSGGTNPTSRQSILANNGVPSTLQPQTMENVERAVAEGRGVITSHHAGQLWGTTDTGGHAVLVTGIEYDENGRPIKVYFNDTGTGACANSIPASQFENSFRPGRQINVTDNPIW